MSRIIIVFVLSLFIACTLQTAEFQMNITQSLKSTKATNLVDESGVRNQGREILHDENDMQTKRYRRRPRPVPPVWPPPVTCPASLSCRNNCTNPRQYLLENDISCLCDKDCDFFKDCCADKDQYCKPVNRTQKIVNHDRLVTNDNKDLWGCYGAEGVRGTTGYYMIGSCPKSWLGNDISYKCRNLSVANKITKDNYRYLPVYTNNGIVYHNRFCAECNRIHTKDLMYFELSIKCSVIPPASLNREQQLAYLFKHCDSDKINWSPPEGGPRRFCIILTEYSRSCRIDVEGKCTNGSVGIVSVIDQTDNYKNIHCADLCDGSGRYDCGPIPFSTTGSGFLPPKPFSFIFDFGSKDEAKSTTFNVKCPEDTPIYDPYLQICRKGMAVPPRSLNASRYEVYEIVLWLKSATPVDRSLQLAMQDIKVDTKNAEKILKISHEQLSNCIISCKSSILFTFRFNLNISSEKDDNSTNNATNNHSRKTRALQDMVIDDHYIDRIINFKNPFDLSFVVFNLTVFKVTTRVLGCIALQKYWRHEYTVSSGDRPAVVITKTKEVLKPNEFYTSNDTSPMDSQAIFVCRAHHKLNCSEKWVLMDEGEFIVLENKTVFVNSSRHLFDESRYSWQNRSVLVCENFSTTYQDKRKIPRKLDQHLLNLTYVCMVVSIVALIFVIFTYSLFSELRTPPGINLMNLSVSILLAQLLWLLGSGQTSNPTVCTTIAVLIHYLFLVSFVWTSIIAFDTWGAFTAMGRRPIVDSKRKRMMHILRYMAVGWLSVMVYVAICVILDQTNTVTIGYRSTESCWIGNRWAILYFFAIPVALILIFNTIFFVLTAKAIKNSSTQARAATDRKDRKKTFGIYIRIASVMGFTWILGFIAPFGAHFLWYLFVIFNGLQGLYIAFAFGLNQRARNLYNNRFPSLNRLRGTTVSSGTTKSTTFDKMADEQSAIDSKL